MTMRLLNELLPKCDETNSEVIPGGGINEALNGKRFAIVEYFCDNHDCNCSGTKISIVEVSEDNVLIGKSIAGIDYDWSNKPHIIKLDTEAEEGQSIFAADCLEVYKQIAKDPGYAERLSLRYKLFKAQRELRYLKNSKKVSLINKLGRNEFCFCGSGKKYKRCCMAKGNEFVSMSLMADQG
jgi:hypothetical protein